MNMKTPLSTTSTGTSPSLANKRFAPLFGPTDVNEGTFDEASAQIDFASRLNELFEPGAEVGGFYVPRHSVTATFVTGTSGNPGLFLPYFDSSLKTPVQAGLPISGICISGSVVPGSIQVTTATEAWSLDLLAHDACVPDGQCQGGRVSRLSPFRLGGIGECPDELDQRRGKFPDL